MIIDVKGTRSGPAEAPAAERYAFRDDRRRSRTPYALAMALLGLAAYLKSFLPSFASGGEHGQQPAPDETAGRGHGDEMAQAAPAQADDDLTTGTVSPHNDGPVGSGRKLVEPYVPASFVAIESPLVGAFLQPEVPLLWSGIPPVRLALSAGNDNLPGPGQGAPGGVDQPGGGDDGGPQPGGGDGGNPPCQGGPGSACDDDDDDDDGQQPAGNRAPRVAGPVYLMDVTSCAVLLIGLLDLLRNAHDPDGDVLSVAGLSVSSGTLVHADGGWLYSAEPRFTGPVTVSYRITDGEFAVHQTAHFAVLRNAPLTGTDGDDNLLGSMCADDIDGGDGDDNIDARGGDDVIHGGAGNDHIVAGDGDDLVYAGSGDDIVFGGNGNDVIYGGDGNDRLFGEAGDDVIFGEDGDDFIDGGAGNDILYGGAGNDIIHDGAGRDAVFGGAGNDRVVAALDAEDDLYDGGEGWDTLDYSAATQALTIDLVNATATGVEIGTDTITGFETILAGAGDDHIIAGHAPAVLAGGGGDNIFEFTGPAPSADTPEPLRFEILDFKAGDRVRMSKYDLFEKVFDRFEDEFEKIYGNDVDDDDVRIRYRHEKDDERERTIIEADFNRDDIYETTITLEGRHLLVIVEHA